MALTPIKAKWSQQLTTGEDVEFTIETTALKNTYAIYKPVLIFHNPGDESCTLEIDYTMDLGNDTDDPLNSGSMTVNVVDTTVAAGARYPYSFEGIQLDNDDTVTVTHTVTITNDGLNTHVFHTLLFGYTEVQTQFSSANSVIRNS